MSNADFKYDLPALVELHPALTFGIDVSAYQGGIDWPAVATVARFAYIKAADHKQADKRFLANWQRSAGLLERGAYQVAYPVLASGVPGKDSRTDPVGAAQYLAGVDRGAELAGVLDIETKQVQRAVEAIGRAYTAEWISEWAEAYQRAAGRAPMLYLSRHGAKLLGDVPELMALPAWWVDYGLAVGEPPRMGKGWERWDVRQFTGAGRCPGVGGKCDLDFRLSNQVQRGV